MQVTALYIYPVKSMRRVSVSEARVETRGFRGDRRWLVVDGDGQFMTMRQRPQLVTIVATSTDEGLSLSRKGFREIDVAYPEGLSQKVVIWNDTVDAVDAGDEVAEWLTEILAEPARLVHMTSDQARPTRPEFAQAGDFVSFADGFPFLLTNAASLVELNSKLESPVPMERFRPNIVVSGTEPWVEERWSRIKIGDVEFRCPKGCGRCIVTTMDQDTGERSGNEPLETLARHRLSEHGAVFGMNLSPDGEGLVKVGDPVTVF